MSGAMMEVGRSAENAFYAFLELVSDVLGFTAKSTTKKNEVGEYFNSLGVKLEKASEELEKVVNKAASGVDKSDESKNAKNPIRIAVDTAKTTLSILKGYVESLAKIGDSEKVGEAATDKEGAAPADVELKKAYNALKGIVDTADKEGVEKLVAGDVAVKVGDNGTDNKDGVKILATVVGNKPGNQDAGKAAAILTTVSGKEILASVIGSKESDAALTANAKADTSAISFARGGSASHLAGADAAKAAAVAGGIALRSLVKSGKLASGAGDGSAGGKEEVQGSRDKCSK
ncbi:Variable major outer membrane lipoprotein [Borrelia duttonii CR2A]|uniref:Variable large protein n=1 Tax=Borrelia duttonii CR2A TaxID=1432657 RepID=W6TG03_9SPIR|nr:Variable major outer membrane lipoprotein [Borrelia duttonii CR2A]